MKRLRVRKKYKVSKVLLIIICLIFFLTFVFLDVFNKKINPKLVVVAMKKMEDYTQTFLSNNIGFSILNNKNLENILIINKNGEGEILYVNYNLDKAYEALDIVTQTLYEKIEGMEDGFVIDVPLFIFSENALWSNFGPKIYMKVNFIGTILTNIRSQITDYGINNALVELYVTIEVTEQLITPVTKEEYKVYYDVLVASSVINGRVPDIYGGVITSESNILNKSIE